MPSVYQPSHSLRGREFESHRCRFFLAPLPSDYSLLSRLRRVNQGIFSLKYMLTESLGDWTIFSLARPSGKMWNVEVSAMQCIRDICELDLDIIISIPLWVPAHLAPNVCFLNSIQHYRVGSTKHYIRAMVLPRPSTKGGRVSLVPMYPININPHIHMGFLHR